MTANDTLRGRNAIVTGASRGIGYAIAESLAKQGVNLCLVATKLDSIEGVAADFQSRYGVQTLPMATDVKDFEAVLQTVQMVQEKWGAVHFLINNAGITRDKLLIQMKIDDWDEVMDTNLKGSFHFIKAVCKGMMKQREGVIINITSVVGLMGNPGQVNYSSAKAGMIGMTKTLARELASRNIRVNAIAPGYIQSDMTEKIPENFKAELMAKIPMGELGTVEDVANCVTFLLSPQARYITGSVIQVDGGLYM